MKLALNKYDTRVLEKSWNKPSSEEREIVALKAQITKLSTSKSSSPDNKDASAPTSTGSTNTNKRRRNGNGKHKPDFTGMKNKVWTGDSKWRGEAPSPGAPTTKVVKGKTYHYCSHHKCWLGHTTASCKAAAKESSGTTSNIHASLANIGLADIIEDDDPDDDE